MIKLQDLTPDVYYEHSRDFQLIGRLFDLVLNSVKTEADLLFNLPLSENSPNALLELLSYTFGLQLRPSKYTDEQLRAICSIAPTLIKNKGSLKAISMLCAAILRTAGTYGTYFISVTNTPTPHITVSIPVGAQQKELLYDLLDQIVPAGLTFEVQQAVLIEDPDKKNYFVLHDSVTSTLQPYTTASSMLASVNSFEVPQTPTVFIKSGPPATLNAYIGVASTAELVRVENIES